MDVARQVTMGCETLKTANRHVLADFPNQGGSRAFNRALAHRQGRQGGNVGGSRRCNQFGYAIGQ